MLRIKPLGAEIREARHNADLTQAELAQRLGVSVRTIQNWETWQSEDDRIPHARHRRAIAEFLRSVEVAAA